MNMEIKFRAWDERQKYMAYQGTPDLETIQSFMHHFGDKELLQFTGQIDKNGTDIYEGDILKSELDKSMVVSWSNEFASFVLVTIGLVKPKLSGESCNPENCEVIGNIHENPELLS